MKRFSVIGIFLLIPALSLFVAGGCDKAEKEKKVAQDGKDAKDNKDNKGSGAKSGLKAGEGVVKGLVSFDGTAPKAEKEPGIDKLDAKEKPNCLAAKEPRCLLEQVWMVDKNGGVANVVISLEPPSDKEYDIDAKVQDEFKKNPAKLDQPCCAYEPHVVALYAPHQQLLVKNSAPFAHNTNIAKGKLFNGKNAGVDPKGAWEPLTIQDVGTVLNISCQMHTFMQAKLVTFGHPYFAVTKDDGTYEISNVPNDVELTVYMWHESMSKKKEMGKITAKGKGPVTSDWKISNK